MIIQSILNHIIINNRLFKISIYFLQNYIELKELTDCNILRFMNSNHFFILVNDGLSPY